MNLNQNEADVGAAAKSDISGSVEEADYSAPQSPTKSGHSVASFGKPAASEPQTFSLLALGLPSVLVMSLHYV